MKWLKSPIVSDFYFSNPRRFPNFEIFEAARAACGNGRFDNPTTSSLLRSRGADGQDEDVSSLQLRKSSKSWKKMTFPWALYDPKSGFMDLDSILIFQSQQVQGEKLDIEVCRYWSSKRRWPTWGAAGRSPCHARRQIDTKLYIDNKLYIAAILKRWNEMKTTLLATGVPECERCTARSSLVKSKQSQRPFYCAASRLIFQIPRELCWVGCKRRLARLDNHQPELSQLTCAAPPLGIGPSFQLFNTYVLGCLLLSEMILQTSI